jgi:hypothetical protein
MILTGIAQPINARQKVWEEGDDQWKTAADRRRAATGAIISANRLHRKWIGPKRTLITAFNSPPPQD